MTVGSIGEKIMKKSLTAVLAAFCSFASTIAGAQDFPRRPMTLIIPFAAGGVTDQVARIVASKVADNVRFPVIVENRPGGGGQIAAGAVKQAQADGYTLLVGDIGTHAVNASLYSKLSYDPVKDFMPVTEMVELPHVLVVPPDSPFKTMKDLVAGAGQNPGKLTYGSVGIGSGAHLLGEMLKSGENLDIVHAPYRGSSQIVPDLIANRIAMFFGAVGSMAPLINEGKLHALVVTDKQRAALLTDVPSAVEAGTPTLDLKVWFGILAPAGTPDAIIDRLNAEFVKALRQPEVRQRLESLGARVIANSSREFAAVAAADTVRLGNVIKNTGMRLD
jgi:tripartite-type tricarboxylate transporter receptor subunit TctC